MSDGTTVSGLIAGAKQVRRALDADRVLRLYVADDADPAVTEAAARRCTAAGIPVERVPTMKRLGARCGLAVGAAVAARVRD